MKSMGLALPIAQRRFPRTAVGVQVGFSPVPVDKQCARYLKGLAEDASLGGMFIATDRPCSSGTVLDLAFATSFDPDSEPTVRARAVVRWNRRFLQPRGMGVEFVEFDGLGGRHFQTWLEQLTADAD